MKIGIITQPLESNYGGIIQNYALQQVLINMGHTPITIDQPSHRPLSIKNYIKEDIITILKNVVKFLLRKGIDELPSLKVKKESKNKKNVEVFIKENIFTTAKVLYEEEIANKCRDLNLEALIVGSDQVWRPQYNLNIYNSFFRFAIDYNIIKVAYAASFGTDEWEFSNKQEKECRNLLKFFSGVGVREISGVTLCEEHFNIKPELVLDPTLLIDRQCYEKLVKKANIEKFDGDIFCYILDKNDFKIEFISEVSKQLHLKPFSVFDPQLGYDTGLNSEIKPPVEKWLRAFMDAKYVICDSFHGVVFSLIFNKDFILLSNKERGLSRFESLFSIFELNKSIIINESVHNRSFQFIQNDWDKINFIKKRLCKQSILFLKTSLDNERASN